MMSYKTPDIYIEEIGSLPKSINQLPTGIPAFLGVTEKQPEPVTGFHKIHSLQDFERLFGLSPSNEKPVQGQIPEQGFLHGSVRLFFDNGGSSAYVYSVGTATSSMTAQDFIVGLDILKNEREPTLVVFPDAVSLGNGLARVQNKALDHCGEVGNRFCILDVPVHDSPLQGIAAFRGSLVSKHLDRGAVYGPWLLVRSLDDKRQEIKARKNALDGVMRAYQAQVVSSGADSAAAKALADQVIAAQRLLNTIGPCVFPASGAVAGVYAAVDAQRGVWKAPANVALSGVVGLSESINDVSQQNLNISPDDGKSINAIRSFVGKGFLIWGSRTLAGNDNEWRHVPVRRLCLMVEEAILEGTAFVVFEPNDANTWIKVKAMIENFLTNLWRQGALAGTTPRDAFFVAVGLNTTMTAQDILDGRLVVEVGLAAVRPAEFIIIRFSHSLQSQ
jgi:phage tail sheath protein FI